MTTSWVAVAAAAAVAAAGVVVAGAGVADVWGAVSRVRQAAGIRLRPSIAVRR